MWHSFLSRGVEDRAWLSYLLAQVFEQNLFEPLNWLAGARLPQYSHFSTEEVERQNNIINQSIVISFTNQLDRLGHWIRSLHGGPFSVRPARAKSLSLRSPATCRFHSKAGQKRVMRRSTVCVVQALVWCVFCGRLNSQGKAPPPPG